MIGPGAPGAEDTHSLDALMIGPGPAPGAEDTHSLDHPYKTYMEEIGEGGGSQ